MASPNMSSASVGSAATNTTDIKAPLWDHVTILEKPRTGGGNAMWRCKYCPMQKLSSYTRVEAHLLQKGGRGIGKCPNVTYEMLSEMRKEIERCKNLVERSKSRTVSLPIAPSTSNTADSNKRNKRGPISALEKAWALEDRKHLDALISRAIYSRGVSFNFMRNPYLREAFTFACSRNMQGYVIPGYNRVREGLLKQERRHIETLLESTKSTWAEKGVTICSDGWSDPQRRPIINFVVVSDKAPMFLRADNCEGPYKSKECIAEKLKGIIEEVGRHNVVQIITDNAANCKGAGLIIESEYDNIFWTPCVVHTLNLAMKSVCEPKIGNNPSDEKIFAWGELEFIHDVKTEAAMIKNFIMNHGIRLSMFNEFSSLKLLSIAETRFASVVCMLKRFVEVKTALQQMVISDKWSVYREVRDDSPTPTVQIVKDLILSDVWWDKDYILRITTPIYEMIRMTDTDTPCLHLVYKMWDSMIEKVKKVNIDMRASKKMRSQVYTRYYSKKWLEEGPGREPPTRIKRNWSTYSFVYSVKRNALTPERAEDLVFVHSNLRHLSRRIDAYKTGETKMWDVGGDSFDSLGGVGILEVADLSLDEPKLQAVSFGLDEPPIDIVDDNETNEE
ncbi:unnamed protein product [Miscanthus lutarioriparius]|uniref:DUF659 domain-containing protein n=1 Tax=Miscanthus lutarioriparius TaxID=422564 RepID=A0A811RAD2_9POAL|nr:unnamed protein product [Miscanthus lutarioriparius]